MSYHSERYYAEQLRADRRAARADRRERRKWSFLGLAITVLAINFLVTDEMMPSFPVLVIAMVAGSVGALFTGGSR